MIRVLILGLLVLTAAMAEDNVVRIENWRVQAGDDPRWAAPDFDDSHWEASSWPHRYTTSQPFFAGTRWYRATASIPANLQGRPLAIALGTLDEVYDVFVDGVLVGTHGNWEPVPTGKFPALLWFPIPETTVRGPMVHIAIRRWTGLTNTGPFSLNTFFNLLEPRAPEIGPLEVIRPEQELRKSTNMVVHTATVGIYVLMLLVGLLSLLLHLTRQGSGETQWLGLALLCEAATPLIGFAVSQSDLPLRSPVATAVVGLQYLVLAIWVRFLASLYPKWASPLRWLALVQGLVALGAAGRYAGMWPLPQEIFLLGAGIAVLTSGAVAIALLAERRGGETALLAGILLVQALSHIWFTQIGGVIVGSAYSGNLQLGSFSVHSRNVVRLIVAVTALAVLYRRHRREQDRQSVVDRDLAAARLVQESLMSGREAAVPGYAVETAYLPASEVGGDFYQELAGPDGSLLVLVGDVSGKGMRAALLVGHISGALSNELSRKPGEVLANLNRSLVGRVSGGFVTCCCARFDRDGRVTVANAGHLAPYAGGREVEVEAGLPLGVVSGVEYAESSVWLDGQFVLLSDGVVEAENGKRELFGFERTREISMKAAREIADAAKAWGQNDDITVVTVRRSG